MRVFETNFENGSLIAKTGEVGVLSGSLIKYEKGICFKTSTAGTHFINYGNLPIFNNASVPFTFVCNFKWYKNNAYGYLLSKRPSNIGFLIGMYFNSIDIIIQNASGVLEVTKTNTFKKGDNQLVITYNGNLKTSGINIIVNGTKLSSLTSTSNTLIDPNILNTGALYVSNSNSSYSIQGGIYKIKWYNHILSQKEIDADYKQFLNSRPTNLPIYFR